MKNFRFVFLLLLPLALILTPLSPALATSGACSSHGGVDCGAGASSDGNVICNDGWTGSSVAYSAMAECGAPSSYQVCIMPFAACSQSQLTELQQEVASASQEFAALGAGGDSAASSYFSGFQSEITQCQAAIALYQSQLQTYQACLDQQSQSEQAPTAPPSIYIATTSIPDGMLNQPYSADITVGYVGSYPTITFSNLPTGSTSSGFVQGGGIQAKMTYANVEADSGTVIAHLTGTPVVAGQYAVTMSVTEGAVSKSQNYSINIPAPATEQQQPATTATTLPSPTSTTTPPTAATPPQKTTQTAAQQLGKQPVKMAPLEPSTASATAQANTGIAMAPSPTQNTPQPESQTPPKASPINRFFSAVASFFKHLF